MRFSVQSCFFELGLRQLLGYEVIVQLGDDLALQHADQEKALFGGSFDRAVAPWSCNGCFLQRPT